MPLLLDMDDATEWYADNQTKDAAYHFKVIQNSIERVGPSNVVHVVTDCCSVMVSMWAILLANYPFLFVSGCICHRLNTLVKHILEDIPSIKELVDKASSVNNYFNNHHQVRSLFRMHCMQHLKKDMAFIVPAVTRFGLFLLMLHRLIIFRPVLMSTIRDPTYLQSCQDDKMDDIITDMTFWTTIYYLTQGLLPLLRLIRLADSDKSYIGKIYPKLIQVKAELRERMESIPDGDKIIKLVERHAGIMIHEIHLASYCVDPEFWDDNHFAMPEVMAAFRSALEKIFYHHGDKAEECIHKAFSEFTEYKDKKGQFADRSLYKLSKNCEPGNFWRVYCSFAQNLRYASVRMLEQKEGASACERNWKEFKWIRSDLRAQLGIEKAVKLVSVHSTSLLVERDDQNYSIEYKKFTDDDELCKLDLGLEAAQMTTLHFNSFLEDWEPVAIHTMNGMNFEKLKAKYMHVHFFDADADKDHNSEVYRVVNIGWHKVDSSSERKAGKKSMYQVLAICLARNGETVTETNDNDCMGYAINKVLHKMIRECPEPYNDAFTMLLENVDV